jgi:6-phosphogluconate dehydrogenase
MKDVTIDNSTLGMIGLGVMGRNLALNLRDHGYRVVAYDESPAARAAFVARNETGVDVASSLEEAVAGIAVPRRLLVMVPAGAPVDSVIGRLKPLLSPGDAIIDGGNTRYQDTQRREVDLRNQGIWFVGMGVSGGESGARFGPSLMPGGSAEAWQLLKAPFEAIAAQSEAGPCVTHVGENGAGHFVKMVHNGIEYGDMQLLAEAYEVLRRGHGKSAFEISEDFDRFSRGPLASYLVELTRDLLKKRDDRTGQPLVDVVLDRAEQKGTGKWTIETALDLGVAIPTITAAVDARILSGNPQRSALAAAWNTAPAALVPAEAPTTEDLELALLVGKVAAYAQGFALIDAAAKQQSWVVNKAEVARIWKAGCIIRARLLDRIMAAYRADVQLSHLFLDPSLGSEVQRALPALRRVVAWCASAGLPVPALGATLNYVQSVSCASLPQNLVQAQRDAFGGHTYLRRDDVASGPQHSEWLVHD